jgi:transcription elongation factor Elf1
MLRSFGSTCPRCGEKFFVKATFPHWHNNLAQRCMNCGLPLSGRAPAEIHASEAAPS